MQFQLVSVTDKMGENEIISIFMSVNGVTFNCTNNVAAFRDAKSAKETLTAVINQLISHCYSINKIDELKEELKILDEKRNQLIGVIKQYA